MAASEAFTRRLSKPIPLRLTVILLAGMLGVSLPQVGLARPVECHLKRVTGASPRCYPMEGA